MVSESVSWPVSMMIGALKPFLRKMRTASRPSMSGSPTSMITRSICPALAACTPLLPSSTATASNSSRSESCSVSASRSSGSSSTMRNLTGIRHQFRPSQPFARIAILLADTKSIKDRHAVGGKHDQDLPRTRVTGAAHSRRPEPVDDDHALRLWQALAR